MKKAFTLFTCKTCQKIFDDLQPEKKGCEVINIKVESISAEDLDAMKERVGTYEALFSRRAMKFRSMGLANKQLTEQDYRTLILEEYTFLKRPVFLFDNEVTVGSRKVEIERARNLLG
ncbi:MAG: arsenate reductase [Crocinitomicaceae bacterium]|nr:arsenate reductase [Crocinitomicaceae bacterium]|tara:strand:+ start:15735 stop:16088 length:354 start_codon:yes stop_codon:yes gene_type:complete